MFRIQKTISILKFFVHIFKKCSRDLKCCSESKKSHLFKFCSKFQKMFCFFQKCSELHKLLTFSILFTILEKKIDRPVKLVLKKYLTFRNWRVAYSIPSKSIVLEYIFMSHVTAKWAGLVRLPCIGGVTTCHSERRRLLFGAQVARERPGTYTTSPPPLPPGTR